MLLRESGSSSSSSATEGFERSHVVNISTQDTARASRACCFVVCLNGLLGRSTGHHHHDDEERYDEFERGRGDGTSRWNAVVRPANVLGFVVVAIVFALMLALAAIFKATAGDQEVQFVVVALGTEGGIDQSGVSGYLITTYDKDRINSGNGVNFLGLDMGSSIYGITAALSKHSLEDLFPFSSVVQTYNNGSLTQQGYLLQYMIKAYALTHPHLDHWLGTVLDSVEDLANAKKQLFASNFTASAILSNAFNWEIWPNFLNSGVAPALSTYQIQTVALSNGSSAISYAVEGTNMSLIAFPLSHGKRPSADGTMVPYISTAFLVTKTSPGPNANVLYFGDTGADLLENSTNIQTIWNYVAPMILNNSLGAIFLECSFPDSYADNQLYGHLNPKWFMVEMNALASILTQLATSSDEALDALQKVKIVVTHIKPIYMVVQAPQTTATLIKAQLQERNNLDLQLIFPTQGDRIDI